MERDMPVLSFQWKLVAELLGRLDLASSSRALCPASSSIALLLHMSCCTTTEALMDWGDLFQCDFVNKYEPRLQCQWS
jgi:hypothetical protein